VLSEADVKEAVRSLLKLHIDLHQPTFQLVDEATENAFAYSITAYDSIYIGLAELLNCVLVTADDELFEKAKESGRISLVSSYPSLRAEQS
jgi:predicted nucleic acid-binding protein